MPHGLFHVTEVNPNDVTGGGGCVCSASKDTDCKPPYCVFPGNDMESPISPHVVIGASCVHLMVKALEGEALSAGERMDVDVEAMLDAEEIPDI